MRKYLTLALMFVCCSVWAQTDSSADEPQEDVTMTYHKMALENAALQTRDGYSDAAYYEKMAFIWEATHDMIPEAMLGNGASLMNSTSLLQKLSS